MRALRCIQSARGDNRKVITRTKLSYRIFRRMSRR